MTTTPIDLGPQTRLVARLAAAVTDEQLTAPTPCPRYAVRELLGWRDELPRALDELADAWRDPAAWTGTTRAGGVDLPGEVAGAVVADELVIHGWDLARATGRPYTPDPAALKSAHSFLLAAAADPIRGGGIFAPAVPTPATAPLLDRALGLSGREREWSPVG
ncbi:TIGR03086 family metal-binding protein [Streptomyces sp. H49]|uniref:TIGR03086 family metal-binding protein n=1 Tax=Streptomyces sp. H49 TaxID=3444117 RepID=UPI003F4A9784